MNDPFAWLEDIENPKTVHWYEAQNKAADAYFETTTKDKLTDELVQMNNTDVRGLPYKHGAYTYWVERKAEWHKAKLLYSTKKLPDEPLILLDFDDSPQSLDCWYPSPSGKKVLYGTSEHGNEQTTIRIFDVLKGESLEDTIPFSCFTDQGNICWLDDRRFIYPRMNGFSKKGPEDKWLLGTKLYLHTLGSDPHDDPLVFGKDLPDTVMLNPTLSCDRNTMYVTVCADELNHELFVVDLASYKERQVVVAMPSACYVKTGFETVYVLTNYDAPHYRLLACDENNIELDLDSWDEVLPESDDVLTDIWLHASKKVLAHYSHNVASELRAFDEYGNQTSRVNIPPHTTVHSIECMPTSPRFYILLSGFTTPPSIYTAQALDVKLDLLWERTRIASDDEIVVEQLSAESTVGTEVPYYVIKHKDTKNAAPTIAYGYGGFNVALEPSYLTSMRPWVLNGGVYVLMNLRGGSEFGEDWHKAGAMQNKQNTFDDCHAIAENLVARGITTKDQLGVLGGSNGGLLVAAVTVQRPDLYRAGGALVPLTDMLEFYKHQVAEFWVHEYGDPRIPEQREWIMKWSPYHNIKPSLSSQTSAIDSELFPALYVECALHDARVNPFHSFKLAAKLQDSYGTYSKGPIIMRTYTDTGHQGSNLTKKDRAAQTAEYLAFFTKELGL